VQVVVDADNKERAVEVQPGPADRIALLLVSSSHYGAGLTFVAGDGIDAKKDSKPLILAQPLVFAGGTVALLHATPNVLKFTNNLNNQPATIDVYVFRDATP
jgi:hypothetical protein